MMVKLCLTASHGYPPGPALLFHQDQNRVFKDCPPYFPNHGARHDITRSNSLSFQHGEPWTNTAKFGEHNQFSDIDSTIKRPVLIDVQDSHPESILFSFGIAEQCAKHEKIMQFLMSGSNELERGSLDLTLLSELMGIQSTASRMQPSASFLYPSGEFGHPNPLVDFVGDMARSSQISISPDGQVLFSCKKNGMKDILSIVAEFYLSRNSTSFRKQSLVPHFNRFDTIEMQANMVKSLLKVKDVTTATLKSPEKTRHKSAQKKNRRKAAKERDPYKRNYFHACESLLSLMMDKKHRRKTAIISLKKSGPELPSLLTQFSIGIAGTGLAVLFSVASRMACTRVPFCVTKLLNTGVGFGLVWLSWAVNNLRDNIIHISKKATKLGLKDEEMMERVDTSMKEVYFRAAALMAIAILRFA